jgi:hypothetical protein
MVIVALLVGGVLTGQALFKSQRLNKVVGEAKQYIVAAKQFRLQYGQLPGDFSEATKVWGSAGACPAGGTASTGKPTCNGDGDGIISLNLTASNAAHEAFRAWQHLSAAGMIVGNYTGVGPVALDISVPRGAIEFSGFGWNQGTTEGVPVAAAAAADANYYDGDYTNSLTFGTATTPTLLGAVLRPDEVYSIDRKADDGNPGLGNIRVQKSATGCASDATTYVTATTTAQCALIFMSTYMDVAAR